MDSQVGVVMTLKNVRISHISMGGSGGEERFTENITLMFEEIEYQTEVKAEDSTSTTTSTTVSEK